MSYIKHLISGHEEARKRHLKDYNYEIEDRMRIAYLYCKKEMKIEDNTNMFIDVKTVTIHKNNIVILCPYMRHPLGAVVGVGEDLFLPITSERSIDKVLFCVAADGVIKHGELMGAVLIVPVDEVDTG
ncbi:MAG: DUF22 domain-containing protein [archaeon]